MNISFKTFYYSFFVLWGLVWIFIAIRFVAIIKNVEPLTIHDIYTSYSGPTGVVKGYYIKKYHHGGPALIKLSSDTTRDYAGFTLARLLYPTKRINKARTVTFYAQVKPGQKNITHFAATAGNNPASKLRLVIDVIDYLLLRYSLLTIAFFIASSFLGDIYKRFKKHHDVADEVKKVYDESNFQMIGMIVFFLTVLI